MLVRTSPRTLPGRRLLDTTPARRVAPGPLGDYVAPVSGRLEVATDAGQPGQHLGTEGGDLLADDLWPEAD